MYPDIDECAVNNGNCAENAICVNTLGSYFCYCRLGYAGSANYHCNGTECFSLKSFVVVGIVNNYFNVLLFDMTSSVRQHRSCHFLLTAV